MEGECETIKKQMLLSCVVSFRLLRSHLPLGGRLLNKVVSLMKRCFATFKARNTNIIKNYINTKEATVIDSFFLGYLFVFLFLKYIIPVIIARIVGNISEIPKPAFRLSPKSEET